MPSLLDLRRRIRSVRNTQQITKAMKMVSAAKLRRAQDRAIAARPYAATLRKLLANVAAAAGAGESEAENPMLSVRPERRIQLILVTADKGLAGSFNSNLIKAGQRFVQEHAGAEIEFELLGRKGRDFFRKRGAKISGEQIGLLHKVNYGDAAPIAQKMIARFRGGEVDAVYIVFNEFKSIMAPRLTMQRVLPIELPKTENPVDYIYEQPPEQLLDGLLPRYIEITLYQAMLESAAAEHAARMTAMDAATSNAADVIEKLTLRLNRVRQASITKEIIEVVSGAAALE
jgi:F-type H+-transporting ATPase subunit gamma